MRRPKRSDCTEDGVFDQECYEEAIGDYEDAEYERKRDMDLDAQLVEGELQKEKADESSK